MDLVDWPTKDSPKSTVPKGSLWRFYNSDNELLYVSIKPNPAILTKNEWWRDVDHCDIVHYNNTDDMLEAKAVAIQNEEPKWNSHGRRTDVD
jgi:hypothetical protein